VAALALLAVVSPACSGSGSTPTPGVTISALSLTVDPNPISTVQSSPLGPTFAVRYTATLRESNGLGGTIELLTGSLFDDATGALIARNQFDDRDLLVFVGARRVEPNGSLAIPQELTYLAPGRRAASLVVSVRFRDDRGNLLEPTLLVKAN
jgi:hypothetical protein